MATLIHLDSKRDRINALQSTFSCYYLSLVQVGIFLGKLLSISKIYQTTRIER